MVSRLRLAPRSCHPACHSGNLDGMKTRTVAERQAIVRAWRIAETAGETQQRFCAQQDPPLSARALRDYLHRYAPTAPPLQAAIDVINRAIADLTHLRGSLSGQVQCTSPAAAGNDAPPSTTGIPTSLPETGPIPMPTTEHPIWRLGR